MSRLRFARKNCHSRPSHHFKKKRPTFSRDSFVLRHSRHAHTRRVRGTSSDNGARSTREYFLSSSTSVPPAVVSKPIPRSRSSPHALQRVHAYCTLHEMRRLFSPLFYPQSFFLPGRGHLLLPFAPSPSPTVKLTPFASPFLSLPLPPSSLSVNHSFLRGDGTRQRGEDMSY